jgi:hypothetical protein
MFSIADVFSIMHFIDLSQYLLTNVLIISFIHFISSLLTDSLTILIESIFTHLRLVAVTISE